MYCNEKKSLIWCYTFYYVYYISNMFRFAVQHLKMSQGKKAAKTLII
jgi:hypothetical protein